MKHHKITLSVNPGTSKIWQWRIDRIIDFNNQCDVDYEPGIPDIMTTGFSLILSCPLINLQIHYSLAKNIDG